MPTTGETRIAINATPEAAHAQRPMRGTQSQIGARIQHETARAALHIIAQKAKAGLQLNYKSLAKALGRGPKDARAVAQVCDLLDSAAALAGRPLMALWTVRTTAGPINPKAWTTNTPPGLREALIEQSKAHTFSDADEAAIQSALGKLTGLGNRKAWVAVRQVFPHEAMLARLLGREVPMEMDTLNDLGSDEPPEVPVSGMRYARDPAVREAVMRRAGGRCEYCDTPGFRCANGSPYLECHQIIALSKDGRDRMTNVIALCPGHRREAHFGERRAELEACMADIVREKAAYAKSKRLNVKP